MEFAKLFVPGIAVVISVVALYYSRMSWLDSNRPIVTLKVSSQGMAGNLATPLSLIVENTGNRPAIDVLIKWHGEEYIDAFRVPPTDERRTEFEDTYTKGAAITVLANGRSVTTSFGFIGPDQDHFALEQKPTWHGRARFSMDVSYGDFDGRAYKHTIPLTMSDDQGFAGGLWTLKE